MSIGDIFYIIAMILFAWITFVIIRNYFRSKFNEDGQRIDMLGQNDSDDDGGDGD